MTARCSLTAQAAAVEALIGLAMGRPKPSTNQRDLLVKQARDAVHSLSWLSAHGDKIRAAFGSDAGGGREG